LSDSVPVAARVVRRFNAPPERVYDAWLDPAMIGGWMFGPALRDEEVVSLSIDARVGGAFSFVVRRQGQEIDHIGEYLEMDRPRRLAFAWGVRQDPPQMSRILLDLAPRDSGSELALTHELHPDWADFKSQSEAAWGRMLDALALRLA
jgi:uncharacterized protein YndB with AHSA1/START domain